MTKIPSGMSEKTYYETVADEAAFLAWYQTQDLPTYERPSVTVDMVAYTFVDGQMKLLLIQRKANPSRGKYALVGGFVDPTEDARTACAREVEEEVNLRLPLSHIEQLMTVSTPGRDPRGWVITIAHLVYLPKEAMNQVRAGDDAKAAYFVDVDFKTGVCSLNGRDLSAEDFAFDHYELIQESIRRIQGRLDWNPTFFHLLEEPFTVYEGTELVNAISAAKPILHNNFLVKYGQYLEEDGVRRIPKKKPKKTYRLKEEGHVSER